MKNVLIYLSILFLTTSCAQTKMQYPALYNDKKNGDFNLNGPVKVVYTKYSYEKKELDKWKNYKLFNDLPKFPSCLEFNEYGLIKTNSKQYYREDTLNIYRQINIKRALNFEYYDEEIKKLQAKKTNLKYYQNVYTDLLYIKPSFNVFEYATDGHLEKYLYEYIYVYRYDTKGRVIEMKEYNPSHSEDFVPLKETRKDELFLTVHYKYNDKSQVIQQTFVGGVGNVGKYGYYNFPLLYEAVYLEKEQSTQVYYTYDKKGRIKEIYTYDNNTDPKKPLYMKAVYYYHPTKDYVEKSENFYEVDSGINDFPTKQWVSYFNEQGDIIKREFILNKFKNATIDTVTRYYEYEYDQYNNWIKCYLYLEGTKVVDDPSLIAERKIEYYND